MLYWNVQPSCEQKHRWLVEYSSEGGLIVPSEVQDHQKPYAKIFSYMCSHNHRGHIVNFVQGISFRWFNRLAVTIASSKTASTYYDSEHITRIKMNAFAYIATRLINQHLNNDSFLYK